MMPNHEYWWNHLSYDQQRYIIEWYETSLEHKDMLYTDIQKDAFSRAEEWHNMKGWPESEMRKVA
jgi:hypothetical protein